MRTFALIGIWLVMGACSGEERVEEPAPTGGDEQTETTPVEPAEEEAPEPELPQLDPATACGRALACCRVFAEAMPNVVEASACAGPLELAEEAPDDMAERCDAMTAGWREALTLSAAGEPPPACAD